jgi:glycine/D-amino acid oxidase-like deaminating enzyme
MIYNRGVYVVPFGDHLSYKVGATYAVNDPTPAISTAGFRELSERLHALLNVPFTITGHDWGMRPTTPDRRPILGASPAHPNVVIFNGLGTKGVTLAPFFSDHLVNWLTNGTDIDTLVDVRRFYLGKRQF